MTDTSLRWRWAVSDSLTMVGRSLRHVTRNVDSLLASVMLPIAMMLMFVYIFGGAIETGSAYVNDVVPGIILQCAVFGSATTAVSVATDMTTGIIDRFRSLPILSSAVLTGHVVASLACNALATSIVIGVAYLVGFRPGAGALEWLGAIGALLLFMFAVSWASVCLGLLANSPEAASGFTFGITFLPYVSSAFVRPDTMPAWLRGFAQHQPITPVIETVRGPLMGSPIGNSAWLSVAWFGAILVAAHLAASYLFRRRTAR